MDDVTVGRLLRAVRLRRGWRQADVATRVGVSISQISRVETGELGDLRLGDLRRIAGSLEVRLTIAPSWRGGDADRLMNASHVALQGVVVGLLPRDWTVAAEVTFSVFGERGAIDLLAWHPDRRALLVIEIKPELTDPDGLLAQVDRYVRLAPGIAAERGWGRPATVGMWVVLAESSMNRRRVARAGTLLRAAFPGTFQSVRAWIREPAGQLAALSFLPYSHPGKAGRPPTSIRRVSAKWRAGRRD